MSHATPWTDPSKAADALVAWISKQPFSGENNFTVGVYKGNHLVISKVGGITTAAASAKEIIAFIKKNSMETGRKIYLAKSFAKKDGPVSNHAEMCILAACGAEDLSYIKCTSPNCKFCKATLLAYDIKNANAEGPDGKTQTGWRHPFLRVNYGNVLSSSESEQLAELKKINKDKMIDGPPKYGQSASYDPKGDMALVLNGAGGGETSSEDDESG